MSDTAQPERFKGKTYIADTIEVSPQEMEEKYIARFRDLVDDNEIFADIKEPEGQRRHFHVISHNNHLGPAKITTPHHFHMSYLEVPPGSQANLHAHDAPEIFIPITGRFAFFYGDNADNSVELDPLDVISLPEKLMRTFKNVGNTNGILMVIYDGADEVLGKIYVNQQQADHLIKNKPQLARDFGLLDDEDKK